MENISVLKQNGFEILVEGDEKPTSEVDDAGVLSAQANERAELGMAVYNDEEGYDGAGELDGPSGGRRRVKLVAQPVSGNTVFDVKGLFCSSTLASSTCGWASELIVSLLLVDFEELLHKMRDLPSDTMVRCSKARAMFASRACRKSIMVGMALENKQMISV